MKTLFWDKGAATEAEDCAPATYAVKKKIFAYYLMDLSPPVRAEV